MGEVCRAEDTKLRREVALKVLPEAGASDSDRLARFEREAKLLASLNHPNPSPHASSRGTTKLRGRLAVSLALALLAGGSLTPLAAGVGDDRFSTSEIVTGRAPSQRLVTAFLRGGDVADLVLLDAGEHHQGVRILSFDGSSWSLAVEAYLRPSTLFVDVASIGGRERLLTYGEGDVRWFDPESGTERPLVVVDHNFESDKESRLPVLDVSRDLNGDGLDDLIFPAVDGFTIFVQLGDGTFAEPMKLGPPEPFRDEKAFGDERTYGEAGINPMTARWYLSRVHRFDRDLDGLVDLAFWNDDHFDVYRQDSSGGFSSVSETLTTDAAFDTDGLYTLIFSFEGTGSFRLVAGLTRRRELAVLHSIRDLDGDGLAELITQTLRGRSVIRMKSRYSIYRGVTTPDGATFEPTASVILEPKGRAGAVQPWGYSSHDLPDFNGDGRPEILLRDTKMGLGGMLRALGGRSLGVDLEIYSVGSGSGRVEPKLFRKIRPKLYVFGPGVFYPPVLAGDVDGDGRDDLLYGQNRGEFRLHLGVAGPELLSRRFERIAVTLPSDETNSRLVDLDRDGKDDIVIHHPSKSEPHRVIVLRAR